MFDPCLLPTTHVNKALQMDPHDSRVVTFSVFFFKGVVDSFFSEMKTNLPQYLHV